jgi:hypothetical protein
VGFKEDIRAFAQGATEKYDRVIRGTVIQLSTRVVMRSPVDTGRFRGNWQVTAGRPGGGPTMKTDKSGNATLAAMKAAIPANPQGQSIYITNRVPYALLLENGHSKQAPGPNAIVGRAVIEFQSYVNKALEEAG